MTPCRIFRMAILSDAPSCSVTYDLTTLEMSFKLLENIKNTGVTHDDHYYNRHIFIVQATGTLESFSMPP
jgi:hypothetical protein